MPRRDFVSLPTTPETGNADLNKFLNSLRENVELLCGLRGGTNNIAVVKGDIEIDYPAEPTVADLDALTSLKETVRQLMVELKT